MRRLNVDTLAALAASIAAAASLSELEPAPAAPAPPTRKRRDEPTTIDFHDVAPQHAEIDRRLRNWATWCNGTKAESSSPMFRLAVPTHRAKSEYGRATLQPVNRSDAQIIASAVAGLPTPHASALHWAYVKPVSPWKACLSIGTNLRGLAQLLHDGRQMLVNRGV